MLIFQDLTLQELSEKLYPLSRVEKPSKYTPEKAEIKKQKQAHLRARQIYQWVYQKFASNWDEMSNVSKEVRAWLNENVTLYQIEKKKDLISEDGTQKFLWNLKDQKTIESVLIPSALNDKNLQDAFGFSGKPMQFNSEANQYEEVARLTICISSQVGCAMACGFCLTGIQGLDRHLATHEIVSQVWELRKKFPITNIVFMGMGEPLHNADNVIKACQILLDQDGLNFSKRKVTVSTSGLVPAIEKLGKSIDVSLAVSLNATTDEQRSQIMPVNKKWNLETLIGALQKFPLSPYRRITFEYVMLKDFNDQVADAKRLLEISKRVRCKINLIPFNEHSGAEWKRPTDQTVRKFQEYLMDHGVIATVRISKGRDILAACGQLRSLFGTARGTEKHKDFSQGELSEEGKSKLIHH